MVTPPVGPGHNPLPLLGKNLADYRFVGEGQERVAHLESDGERSNHSKIRNMPSNAKLGRDVKQGPGPYDCAEAHVNGAQYAIRVEHDEIRKVRVGKVSNIK